MASVISRSQAKKAYQSVKSSHKAIEKMTKAELMGLYYEKAKAADKKLVAIEKLSQQPGYKNVEQWSYARALKDIQHAFNDPDAKARFDRVVSNKTKTQIKALINDITTFTTAPTSSKRGIDNVARQRAKTINQKYGTNFSWQELAAWLSDDKFNELVNKGWGSTSAWYKVADIQKKIDEVTKAIKGANKKTQRTKLFNKAIKKLLSNNKLSIEDLI